jgi:glutaredoxin 3
LGRLTVDRGMHSITIFTTSWCGFCARAKAFLDARGIEYEEIEFDGDAAFRSKLFELTGNWTVPQILIDGRPIGGYSELRRLEADGRLDKLLAA